MNTFKRALDFIRLVAKRFGNWIFQGNTRVKIVFVLLSAVLWFLIKLSKPGYENVVKLPILIQNVPQEQVLVSTSHDYLSLRMRSNGFNLLKYSFWKYKDIKLDLKERPRDSTLRYHWNSQDIAQELTEQLSEQVSVLAVQPDTITVKLNRMVTRSIPVKPHIDLSPSGPRVLYEPPRTQPAAIQVTGPSAQVAALDTLYTEKWNLGAPDKDSLQARLGLILPEQDDLQFARNTVVTTVKLARLTEKTLSVPIELRNEPPNLEVELFPGQIEVTYRVALRDYNTVNAQGFELFIDWRQEQPSLEQRFLTVKVGTVPPQVRKYRLARKRVEYIAKAL